MRKIVKRSDCPISYSLDLLGDKWTILILRDIALGDKHFYKDFFEAGEGIATNVLADRLRMLEEVGIIQSKPYEKKKNMKYYSMTKKGTELIPMMIELWVWGAKHDPESSVSEKTLDERLLNREEIIAHYKAKSIGEE
ncbi:MAG: helix-turn-helix domain-containing protein [Bacteroidota bacterium]